MSSRDLRGCTLCCAKCKYGRINGSVQPMLVILFTKKINKKGYSRYNKDYYLLVHIGIYLTFLFGPLYEFAREIPSKNIPIH